MECIAIKEFITFILVLTMIRIIKCSDDWPTYLKKDGGGSFQRCYECPPGYYLIKECPLLHNPAVIDYSTCGKCPEGQFSQRWNHDPRCWDHTTCRNGKVDICVAGTIGPTECGCAGKTHEENGQCVKSISLDDHKYRVTEKLAQRDEEHKKIIIEVRSQICPPCSIPDTIPVALPSTSATEFPCIVSYSPQPECISASPAWQFLLAVIGGMVLMPISMYIFKKLCRYLKKKKPLTPNGETKKDNDYEANTLLPKNGNRRAEFTVDVGPPEVPAPTIIQEDHSQHGPIILPFDDEPEHSAPIADQRIIYRKQPEISVADKDLEWDKVSLIFEKRLRRADIETFQRYILELDGRTCDGISERSDSNMSKIQNGVKKYRETKGTAANFYELLRSLRKENRSDIADEIVGKLDIKDEIIEPSNRNKLDDAFKIVENEITIPEARVFFRHILTDQQLKVFEQVEKGEETREGLRLWQNGKGRNASVKKLWSHLKYLKYTDIAEDIKHLVNNEGDDLVNNDRNTAGSVTTRNVENAESGSLEDKAGPERQPGVRREIQSEEGQSDANSSGAARSNANPNGNTQTTTAGPERRAGVIRESPPEEGQSDANSNPSGNTQTTTVSDGQDDDAGGIKCKEEGVIQHIDQTNEKPDQGGKATPDDGDVQMAEKETTQKSECGVPIQETIPKELYEGGNEASSENETTPKEVWKDDP